jgi:flagellar biosynthesis/type III secretory pathway chaperone
MTTEKTTKAKRRLKEITFDHENAHLALCSKEQGAANNSNSALIIKSKVPVEKLQQVKVTFELPEFLSKMYGMYYGDSHELAALLGYVEPESEKDTTKSYTDYIEERLKSFEIIKAAKDVTDIQTYIDNLNDSDIQNLIKDKYTIEKALSSKSQEHPEKQGEPSTEVNKGVSPVNKKKEKEMQEKQIEEITKAKDEAVAELLKAKESMQALQKEVELMKAEKQEAILKSKVEAIAAVVTNKEHAEVIAKAAVKIDNQEDFTKFVDVIKALQVAVTKSALFSEVGASGGSSNTEDSAVAKILKAQFQKV